MITKNILKKSLIKGARPAPLLKAREGEEAVLNLEEAVDELLLGSTVGAFNNTPKLFDISLDAYGDKISRKNKYVSQTYLDDFEKREN